MELPLVSIIIPVYNAEKHLAETLNCALNQTWPNKEIILVNDGSTDRSVEIINSYKNPEIILIEQTNQGASAAKQNGLNHAKGEFIQYLDADDILDPKKIEQQVIELRDQPGKIAVCKTAHFLGDYINDNIPDDDHFFTEYLDEPLNFLIKLYGGFDMTGGMIQPNAFLAPANIIADAGPWDTSISPCTDEDGEYFCRVILKSNGLVYQPQILNYYRKVKNKKSLSGIVNEVTYSNLVESIWLKHHYLLASTSSDYQVKCIHTATYRCLDEIKVQIYFKLDELVSKISFYQDQLSPATKPGSYKLGGKVINFISKTMGWKFAKKLQHIVQSRN